MFSPRGVSLDWVWSTIRLHFKCPTLLIEPPCEQGGRRLQAKPGNNHNLSLTGHCGGGVVRDWCVVLALRDPSVTRKLVPPPLLAGEIFVNSNIEWVSKTYFCGHTLELFQTTWCPIENDNDLETRAFGRNV